MGWPVHLDLGKDLGSERDPGEDQPASALFEGEFIAYQERPGCQLPRHTHTGYPWMARVSPELCLEALGRAAGCPLMG